MESVFTGGGSEEVRHCRTLAFENERLKRLLDGRELEVAVLKGLVKNDSLSGKELSLGQTIPFFWRNAG